MKRFSYLIIAALTMAACSVDPIDNENFNSFDAKAKAQIQAGEFVAPEFICAGEPAEFAINAPVGTNIQVQLWNEETQDWEQVYQIAKSTASPQTFNLELETAGDYDLRHKAGGGGFTETSVTAVECNECEESFAYVDHKDGSYTFTYVPAENMTDAEVVFTFAQGVAVEGLEGWNVNGQTRQNTMDLEACETYIWIVTLKANCSGNSSKSNVWTDFKVNDISKKADEEDKFIQSCN